MLINPSLFFRFSTNFAYYNLAMSVEEFGVNINFLQPIFGEVDIQAKFTTIWTGALPRPLLYSWQEGPSWLSSLCPWVRNWG